MDVFYLGCSAHSRFTVSTRDGGKYLTPLFALEFNRQLAISNWYVWAMIRPSVSVTSLFRFGGVLRRDLFRVVSMIGQVSSGFTMQLQTKRCSVSAYLQRLGSR